MGFVVTSFIPDHAEGLNLTVYDRPLRDYFRMSVAACSRSGEVIYVCEFQVPIGQGY